MGRIFGILLWVGAAWVASMLLGAMERPPPGRTADPALVVKLTLLMLTCLVGGIFLVLGRSKQTNVARSQQDAKAEEVAQTKQHADLVLKTTLPMMVMGSGAVLWALLNPRQFDGLLTAGIIVDVIGVLFFGLYKYLRDQHNHSISQMKS